MLVYSSKQDSSHQKAVQRTNVANNSQPGEDSFGHRLATFVRWTAFDGSCLVWRSKRAFLDLHATNYWRPILLNVPLLPRGCAWLRFDILTDDENNSRPIGSGFLFNTEQSQSVSARVADKVGFEVLGFSRIPGDGAVAGKKGRFLEEVGRNCVKVPTTVHSSADNTDLAVLRTEELAGLEVLFFVGWHDLGRSLVSARLPAE